MKGLEPPRLSAPDPKSGAATNYATSAFGVQNYKKNQYIIMKYNPQSKLFFFSVVNCHNQLFFTVRFLQ
jgi:hypothetical protein